MHKVEANNWLGNNQTGRRKNFCAVETGTIDQLIIEAHRLTKYPLCIHQDDTMGCYDRIIRSHAILIAVHLKKTLKSFQSKNYQLYMRIGNVNKIEK